MPASKSCKSADCPSCSEGISPKSNEPSSSPKESFEASSKFIEEKSFSSSGIPANNELSSEGDDKSVALSFSGTSLETGTSETSCSFGADASSAELKSSSGSSGKSSVPVPTESISGISMSAESKSPFGVPSEESSSPSRLLSAEDSAGSAGSKSSNSLLSEPKSIVFASGKSKSEKSIPLFGDSVCASFKSSVDGYGSAFSGISGVSASESKSSRENICPGWISALSGSVSVF